jgi:hypothetical protein
MYVCMNVYVCILFNISKVLAGSLGSVGVGTWYCMLKGPGSNHLCELRSLEQVFFSWGGGGDPIKVERKFPTTFWNM